MAASLLISPELNIQADLNDAVVMMVSILPRFFLFCFGFFFLFVCLFLLSLFFFFFVVVFFFFGFLVLFCFGQLALVTVYSRFFRLQ